MIDKIKRYDMKYDHDAMENAMAPDVAGDYVLFHAHEMALAAKDARIAELEQKVIGLEDYVASIPDYRHLCKELRDKLTAQQQAEPATHSEDGGEVPEVIAVRREPGHWNDPLMTVAQHERITKQLREEAATAKARQDHAEMVGDDLSRIVAAKDAEIARLDAGWHKANKKVLEISLAQPARQVGGDEREKFEAWAQQNGIATTRTSQGIAFANGQRRAAGDYILIEALCAYAAWQARAALAPAAVVMAEPVATILSPDPYDERSGFYVSLPDRAKLAYLPAGTKLYAEPPNRRAIPAGLLERICKDYTGRENWDALEPDRLAAAAELRALLGKGD